MKKVMVIGCPGSGKSTLSRALHEITGLPLTHLDLLYWNADRTTADKAVFRERLQAVLRESEWILDGNYGSTMELRLQACDTVIFLDYPLDVCLSGIRDRKGKPRTDMPWFEAAEEEEDPEFIGFIKDYASESRPKVLELLERYPGKTVLILKSRAEADRFLAGLKKETYTSAADKQLSENKERI